MAKKSPASKRKRAEPTDNSIKPADNAALLESGDLLWGVGEISSCLRKNEHGALARCAIAQ